MRKLIEKEETDQQIESLKLFLQTGDRPKKNEETNKKTGNESNVNIVELNQKYSKIPQHFSFCLISDNS